MYQATRYIISAKAWRNFSKEIMHWMWGDESDDVSNDESKISSQCGKAWENLKEPLKVQYNNTWYKKYLSVGFQDRWCK